MTSRVLSNIEKINKKTEGLEFFLLNYKYFESTKQWMVELEGIVSTINRVYSDIIEDVFGSRYLVLIGELRELLDSISEEVNSGYNFHLSLDSSDRF